MGDIGPWRRFVGRRQDGTRFWRMERHWPSGQPAALVDHLGWAVYSRWDEGFRDHVMPQTEYGEQARGRMGMACADLWMRKRGWIL